MTREEIEAQVKKEGRWDAMVALQQQRRAKIDKIAAEMRRAEAPLVEALNRVGQKVSSVHALLYRESRPIAEAIPVLLEHLRYPYPDEILEGIGRALAVPEARIGWAFLLDEFRRNPDRSGQHAKAGLACALAGAADDEHLDDIIGLLKDPRHGYHRLFLLDALAKSRDPRARSALLELRTDPELAKAVQKLLKRKSVVRPAVRKEKDAAVESSSRLSEASINLDAGQVEPLLHRIASLVAGFGAAEINSAVEALEGLEVEDHYERTFKVAYEGATVPLKIRVSMDDVDAPDLYVFTTSSLAKKIQRLMQDVGDDAPSAD